MVEHNWISIRFTLIIIISGWNLDNSPQKKFRLAYIKAARMTLTMIFLQTFYGETPCVSNTREVISGLPTGKLRVMHLALANSRQERAAALAMRAA